MRRKIAIPLIYLVLSGSALSAALAQGSSKDDAAIGQTLNHYATINGGWRINENCKFLSKVDRRQFEWSISNINRTMARQFGPKILNPILNAAAKTADGSKYSTCGESAREAVGGTFGLAQKMNKALTGQEFDPQTSYQLYIANRYFGIDVAMKLETRCKHLAEEARPTVLAMYKSLTYLMPPVVGGGMLNAIFQKSLQLVKSDRYQQCGGESEALVNRASVEIGGLLASLRQDKELVE